MSEDKQDYGHKISYTYNNSTSKYSVVSTVCTCPVKFLREVTSGEQSDFILVQPNASANLNYNKSDYTLGTLYNVL